MPEVLIQPFGDSAKAASAFGIWDNMHKLKKFTQVQAARRLTIQLLHFWPVLVEYVDEQIDYTGDISSRFLGDAHKYRGSLKSSMKSIT
jgi:hypothetical protein